MKLLLAVLVPPPPSSSSTMMKEEEEKKEEDEGSSFVSADMTDATKMMIIPSNSSNLSSSSLFRPKTRKLSSSISATTITSLNRIILAISTSNTWTNCLEKEKESTTNVVVPFIYIEAFADGLYPFSINNLKSVKNLAGKYGKLLVLDASRILENAWYKNNNNRIHDVDDDGAAKAVPAAIDNNDNSHRDNDLIKTAQEIVKYANVITFDATQDAKCSTGALLATNDQTLYEKLMNEVVVYEGLHTYGGMSGRTMESFAIGLEEMMTMMGSQQEMDWIIYQSHRFCTRLHSAGVPLLFGCDGAYLDAGRFLPHIQDRQHLVSDTLSAALYEMSGIRALAIGRVAPPPATGAKYDPPQLLPLQIPKLAMTNRQLDQVADAIIQLYNNRDKVSPLLLNTTTKCSSSASAWRDQVKCIGVYSDIISPYEFDCFPYICHTIERTGNFDREDRRKAIEAAGYNTFLLRSADVTIDLLTDSGTSAMSTDQWAAYIAAQSTPATSDEYKRLVSKLQSITGYQYILPVHQGRAAEQILSEVMIQPGQLVPGNMYFTTTKLHQELAGGVFADIIVDEAHDPQSDFPWKGNIDLSKLRRLIQKHGRDKIAYVSFEHSVNMAGGQPVSMENMRDVYAYCASLNIPVFFDSTRAAENAIMIQNRDPNYATTKVRGILRQMMMYGDGCTVSGKKDFLINIGGVLAFRDNAEWKEKSEAKLRVYEGSITDGGLTSADLAATTVGLTEMVEDRYIRSRVLQTAELGRMLIEGGVPIVTPIGSHAIFLDAKRFLPHVDQDEFPAQCLAAEIFVETGVRAMERGTVSKGRDPKTGENIHPALELVRLTIPRRLYSMDHMRDVASGIIRLYKRRDQIEGLRLVYEPKKLRFFQGRFERLKKTFPGMLS